MRMKLSVQFQGEEGIDAGGVSREWYQVGHLIPCPVPGVQRLPCQLSPLSLKLYLITALKVDVGFA